MRSYRSKKERIKSQKVEGRNLKGSLTLEAALVLPIFIFAILAFIYLLQALILHNNLQNAITEIGLDSAKYGYVYESIGNSFQNSDSANNQELSYKDDEGVIDSTLETLVAKSIDSIYFKTKLYYKLDIGVANNSIIRNGFAGIHTYLSSYMEEDDEVDIILNYNLKLPLVFFNINDFQIVQRVKLKIWNGYRPPAKFSTASDDLEEQDEEIVFITPSGNVYHISRGCSHISLSIRSVPYEQVKDLRNKSGGRYTSCSICWSNSKNESLVYITTSGDRYHKEKNCSGLKRTVIEVPISKVKDKSKCKRCGS